MAEKKAATATASNRTFTEYGSLRAQGRHLSRVPDAAQRPFGGAPQSRDPRTSGHGPRISSAPRRRRRAAQHPGNAATQPSSPARSTHLGKPLADAHRQGVADLAI